MTPETQAAAKRVAAYLDARSYILGDLDQIAEAKNGGSPWGRLTVTDLRTLLAALDPAEQPTDDTRAAAARLAALIDNPDRHLYATHRVNRTLVPLDEADVADARTLLAAVDEFAYVLAIERTRTASAERLLVEASVERDVWKGRAIELNNAIFPGEAIGRHEPLTDESCGHVPTDRGRQAVIDYHALRREQHPRQRP